MKKIIYSILISAFIFSCNSDNDSAVNQSFEENSKTQVFDEVPGENEANIRTSCSS